jgi:uncharacterized protein (TIGR03084 family)
VVLGGGGGCRAGQGDVGPAAARCIVRWVTIFDDLAAEHERLEAILAGLTDADWMTDSAAPGWSVADVVLHLAQTEEAVIATIGSSTGRVPPAPARQRPASVDKAMAQWVAAERAAPDVVFARWRRARRTALDALRRADPHTRVAWAAAPLKPTVLATTRLAEHWAHTLDIVGPLDIDVPDTDRLRHIAWLAHRSLPTRSEWPAGNRRTCTAS